MKKKEVFLSSFEGAKWFRIVLCVLLKSSMVSAQHRKMGCSVLIGGIPILGDLEEILLVGA